MQVRRFADLGQAESSFLAFSARHAAHLERFLGSAAAASGSSRRAETLEFAARLHTATPSLTTSALRVVVCEHFRVSSVGTLGWTSADELLRSSRECAQRAAASLSVPCASLLALSPEGGSDCDSRLLALDVVAAERAVLSTPLLEDIAAHTQWHQTFGPQLGVSLRGFLLDSERTKRLQVLETTSDLSYLILSYLILTYLILSYLILSYLILSYLNLS